MALYTNRLGDAYTVRRLLTRAGVERYVAVLVRADEVGVAMPPGYGFAENVHGKVSVRRLGTSTLRPGELARVRRVLEGHPPTRRYRAEEVRGAIVVYHPLRRLRLGEVLGPGAEGGRGTSTRALLELAVRDRAQSPPESPDWRALFEAVSRLALDRTLEALPDRYMEVLRLRPLRGGGRTFVLERRFHSGQGGWDHLDQGPDPAVLLGTVLADLEEEGPSEAWFERL